MPRENNLARHVANKQLPAAMTKAIRAELGKLIYPAIEVSQSHHNALLMFINDFFILYYKHDGGGTALDIGGAKDSPSDIEKKAGELEAALDDADPNINTLLQRQFEHEQPGSGLPNFARSVIAVGDLKRAATTALRAIQKDRRGNQ